MTGFINIATALFLFITSADLPYLYYAHAWYDPYRWIEIVEVTSLYVITILSISWFIILIKRLLRE